MILVHVGFGSKAGASNDGRQFASPKIKFLCGVERGSHESDIFSGFSWDHLLCDKRHAIWRYFFEATFKRLHAFIAGL